MVDRLVPLAVALTLAMAVLDASAADTKARPAAKRPAPVNLTPAYNSYLNRLRQIVGNNWNVPNGKNSVVVQAVVAGDGSVSDVTAVSTPRNPAAEQAGQAALAESQPLQPLPAGSPPVKLVLTFQSSSDPHGDSSSNLAAKLEPIPIGKTQPAKAEQ